MKKIIVTGGSGFIEPIQLILIKKYFVINLDKLTYSANKQILTQNQKNYKLIKVDINNKKLIRIIKKHKPIAIFNLAAETHVDRSIDGPKNFIQTNIIGTFSLLESLSLNKKISKVNSYFY